MVIAMPPPPPPLYSYSDAVSDNSLAEPFFNGYKSPRTPSDDIIGLTDIPAVTELRLLDPNN